MKQNEEQIKNEIGKTLCEGYPLECEKCFNNPCKWEEGSCSTDDDVDKLFEANYRKVEQILNEIDNETNGQTIAVTNMLRKKYGIVERQLR